MTDDELRSALRDAGVVDSVLSTLGLGARPPASNSSSAKKPNIPAVSRPGVKYVYLTVAGGRAFIEHTPGHCSGGTFVLHTHHGNQRFRTSSVACDCDPAFDEGFLFEIAPDTPTRLISDPIHVVLTHRLPSGETTVVGSHFLDWRVLLAKCSACTGDKYTSAIELAGVGSASGVSAGILNMRVDVLPTQDALFDHPYNIDDVAADRDRMLERERLFLVYAKQWWREVSKPLFCC